ncbi:enoyl-CoA hydratase/isomerase [Brevibacillus laterosporus]|uniref:enoyl-CoA hydratase/isomerase n=1 Tax=Brevibacillus laterosporus TaxID=1465 RepID=UPI000CE5308A|nr:enoyl-CoA hydratase/isomerase [Brevibacillus laterosporus]MED1663363.1 enoyl-CoA hydratase/isomerase [Brevibacillus laterosporus]MED1668633.1 enoyl-CoA hydratase/isomerase [Brevibacillus laterosporus]MED1717422.1 enoyl-CoA hydratase/isomerase [Brevibacillus laterosporus]PPA90022.1 enoyl-CoA hydratase [Brevibacillus laterosporus]
MNYETIKVRVQESICFVQFDRPEANNAINDRLIEELGHVLAYCEEKMTIVVLEGLPQVFCIGADFQDIHYRMSKGQIGESNPEALYELWRKLTVGSFITISHVRGKANAGGMGFIAASDIVVADETAQFSLSELLFGLYPACVLPFLINRIGRQKSHYLTLMTQPISVQQAHEWGVVDAWDSKSDVLLRKHLLRLKRLPKAGIANYKRYISGLDNFLQRSKTLAVSANRDMFSDRGILEGIYRYVDKGEFPWED